MFVLYNLLQAVFVPLFSPFITLFVLFSAKYRNRIPSRLGRGLARAIGPARPGSKTIWLHALSVGEIISAVPLVAGLRRTYPDSRIVCSVTTSTGRQVAEQRLSGLADQIVYGPLDLLPVVGYFVRLIRPDLYVLVETDLWPNLLLLLRRQGVPTLLVNGRMTRKSMARYRRLGFFFLPMFDSFSFLCLQKEQDLQGMVALGLNPEKLRALGNIKFDAPQPNPEHGWRPPPGLLPPGRLCLICGSTHPGEEAIFLECFCLLREQFPTLYLIIAPRDIRRTGEIADLAAGHGLTVARRSSGGGASADLLLLDTLGELVHLYRFAHIAVIGGSFLRPHGHNPIEPAMAGIPVIFGPNMQEFPEVAALLIASGGATQVADRYQLTERISALLLSPELRHRQGEAARRCVANQRGVIENHLELLRQLL